MKLSRLLYYKSDVPMSYLPRKKPGGPMFSQPEVNRMIDAHQKVLEEKGTDELKIPEELHTIRRRMFSGNALSVADRLIENGFHAYLCGGAVRDLAMGDTASDFDFVTDASNGELRDLFDDIRFHVIQNGHEFGYIDFGNEVVDVCTMVNIPAEYKKIKNIPDFDPESLYSRELLFDAYQRDFTINAMYYDMDSGEIIDWFTGLRDLRDGVIRTTVPAEYALDYAPRTMLRALRFKARFGYDLSEDLDEVIRRRNHELLRRIPPASVRSNLPEFFYGGYTYDAVCNLMDYDLLSDVLPALGDMAYSHSYIEYAKRTAYAVDWLFDEGAVGLPLLAMAAFLWPAVDRYKDKGVDDAALKVFRMQESVMSMTEKEEQFFLEALQTQEAREKEQIMREVQNIFGKPTFEDALGVLRVHYWNHPV